MAEARLLVPAVLRPFGEHLAAVARPRSGDVCVDIGHNGGVMPALLARVARLCVAVGEDTDALREVREELDMLHRPATAVLRARIDVLPLRDGCAQVVTALFSLPDAPDPVAALREMLRVLDPQHGRLAAAMWSEPGAVPHLAAAASPDAAHAYGYPLAAERLVEQAGGEGRITVARIHDVVRFDGVAHWWAAVGDASREMPDAAAELLAPYTAADGTMRIPAEAVVLTTAT